MHQGGDADTNVTAKNVTAKSQACRSRTWGSQSWARRLRLAPLLAIALMTTSVLYFSWKSSWNFQTLAENHRELRLLVVEHHALAFATYLLLYMLVASLSLPGCAVLSVAGGLLFGWFVGAVAGVTSATVGATLFFVLARTSLGQTLALGAGSPVCRLRKGFQENALSYLIFMRLTPAFPFGAVSVAAAFFNMRVRDFALGTFVGVIPATLLFAASGAQIDRILATQHKAYEQCVQSLLQAGQTQGDLSKGAPLQTDAPQTHAPQTHAPQTGSPQTDLPQVDFPLGGQALDSADSCVHSLTVSDLVTQEALYLLAALGVFALLPVLVKKLRKNTTGDA